MSTLQLVNSWKDEKFPEQIEPKLLNWLRSVGRVPKTREKTFCFAFWALRTGGQLGRMLAPLEDSGIIEGYKARAQSKPSKGRAKAAVVGVVKFVSATTLRVAAAQIGLTGAQKMLTDGLAILDSEFMVLPLVGNFDTAELPEIWEARNYSRLTEPDKVSDFEIRLQAIEEYFITGLSMIRALKKDYRAGMGEPPGSPVAASSSEEID